MTGELVMRKLLSEPNRTYQNKSEETVSLSEGNYLPSAFFLFDSSDKAGYDDRLCDLWRRKWTWYWVITKLCVPTIRAGKNVEGDSFVFLSGDCI